MKKSTYESWVRRLVENLASHLNLSGWTIHLKFSDEDKQDIYAEASTNSVYMSCLITLYRLGKTDFEGEETDRLIMALVHELCHILVDPFHQEIVPFLSPSTTLNFMNILEQQTQKLTMVILKTLPKNLIPPR